MEAKKAITYWDEELSQKAKSTQKEYRRYFGVFLEWAKLDAEGLYTLHKESLEHDDKREAKALPKLVERFLNKMEKDGYSNSTQNQTLKAIKSFMDANSLVFPLKKLRRRRISNGARCISATQIKEIFDYAMGVGWTTLRNRTLYMTLKDSGLRVSDASALNIEQYHSARTVEIDGVTFKVFQPFSTVKTGDLANTILGPESTEHIDKLIEGRTKGPIFLDDNGNRWSPEAMSVHLMRVKAYVLKKDGYKISAHSFRKFFVTMLQGAGVPMGWIHALQGKAKGEYNHPEDIGQLEPAYAKAYNHLRIHTYNADTENRIQTLEQDLKEVKDVLVIFQGMTMDNQGIETRDELIKTFNTYVLKTLKDKKQQDNTPITEA